MRRITLFLLFLFVCSATSIAQGLKPDRAAFLNEVLDPRPTAVTPKFDDYHPGITTPKSRISSMALSPRQRNVE